MHVQPYVYFDGRCEEALEFYKKAIGAKVDRMLRFSQMPAAGGGGGGGRGRGHPAGGGACGPVSPEAVMHAEFRIGDSTLMASDGHAKGNPKFEGISPTIQAAN